MRELIFPGLNFQHNKNTHEFLQLWPHAGECRALHQNVLWLPAPCRACCQHWRGLWERCWVLLQSCTWLCLTLWAFMLAFDWWQVFYFKVQPFIWSCAPFAHSFVVPHVFQFQEASRGCAKWGDASPAPDFISGQGSVPCTSSRAPAVGRAPRTCEPTDPFPLPFLVPARFNQI